MLSRMLLLRFAVIATFLIVVTLYAVLTAGTYSWPAFIEWCARRFTRRVIWDRPGEHPYQSRYYLKGGPRMPDGSNPFDATGQPREGIVWREKRLGIHLHNLHRSDSEPELHSHPWRWSFSIILSGGYVEERREILPDGTRTVRVKRFRPGMLNFIRGSDYHRLDVIPGKPCWTLFVAGPRVSTWWFWNRETFVYTEWREFIAGRRS